MVSDRDTNRSIWLEGGQPRALWAGGTVAKLGRTHISEQALVAGTSPIGGGKAVSVLHAHRCIAGEQGGWEAEAFYRCGGGES